MKIPKTKKIAKLEILKGLGEIEVKEVEEKPKTISFRPNHTVFAHFNEVREKLENQYGVEFNNTEVIEFALAFTFENYCSIEEEE